MNNEPITCLEQILSYDVIANILCITVDEFSVFSPNDAAKYIEYIERKGSSIRVKAMLPGSKKRVQLIIGIAKTNPLDVSDLIAGYELYKIMKDKAVRRLQFVWIVTSPSDYPHNGVNLDTVAYLANIIKPKTLDDIMFAEARTKTCDVITNALDFSKNESEDRNRS